MTDKRIQFNNIVNNQLPSYVKEEFPLVAEFLSQYYISQEFKGAPIDLIESIDKYIKLDEITHRIDSVILLNDISFIDDVITVDTDVLKSPTGTQGFPEKYGLLKIDDEIITYTGITTNSFTGCIRGFSGISSYISPNNPDKLLFSKTDASDHSAGSKIINLSSLFLKEFLLKIKYQLTPGFENREFTEKLNESLFIKQLKDFYRSKGTDESFKILFKSLYGENVSIIRPKEYLFRPSDAQFKITRDLVVESIEGNPENLENSTLYQKEYVGFSSAYAPIGKVEKIVSKDSKEYYKLSIDANYDRDIRVDGALYGEFKIHPQTTVIGEYNTNSSVIDVDSTIGFPESGELFVTYNDNSTGTISYTSKNLNQFFGCTNITGIIKNSSKISLDVFAYGRSFVNQDETIKVRITSVLKDLDIVDDTFYLKKGYKSEIKTLGVNSKDTVSNNWIFNLPIKYNVDSISLIDISSNTYQVNVSTNHIFRVGDTLKITNSNGVQLSSVVVEIVSEKSFIISEQGVLSTTDTYTVERNILKSNALQYPEVSIFNANVQNVYKNKNKTLVASSSLPYYEKDPLKISSRQVIFSVNLTPSNFANIDFVNEFRITNSNDHGFYTGDAIYYTPQKSGDQVISQLFDEGIYYIFRVNPKNVKFSRSRANIDEYLRQLKEGIVDEQKFVCVTSPVNAQSNKIEPYIFKNKTLKSQNILREILPPENDGGIYNTEPGFTGILINGVEILNYKSKDIIYSGKLEEIEVVSPGEGYDIINPPTLSISDPVGSGASAFCAVKGSLQEIRIIDPGFDYKEIPVIKITGGNGAGAKAYPNMMLVDHESIFNSEINSAQVSISNNSIGFSTYHKFENAERVIYITNGQKSVGGLSTESSYYVSIQSPTEIKLHRTLDDVVAGINTIQLTSFGIGNHSLKSFDKKLILGSVNIENSGTGYENKKRTVLSSISGINTSINQINIQNHDFKTGEIVKYSSTGIEIGGLVKNKEYYVTIVDNNSFKLSQIGSDSQDKDFFINTKQYINLSSVGTGVHSFNYPEISVEIIGNVGGSIPFKASVQPIFRGEITSVHLQNGGVGYGSSEIFNYNRQPTFRLLTGFGAQVTPIISNGKIVEVLINSSGSQYNCPPNLEITGDGIGASLTPIVKDGKLVEIKVINSGIGYSPNNTFVSVLPAGSLSQFFAKIQTWNVNLFERYLPLILNDDGILCEGLNEDYGLQYSHLYTPRKLREIVYANSQDGDTLYGKNDLIKVQNQEVASEDHSPIIGWAYDGNPIYGPYGYSTRQGGTISQMKSGYRRDKTAKANRPLTSKFPLGFFVEDYTYYNVSDETVLDEYNGRFCITPDFPNGTYAYFTTISDSDAEKSGSFLGYKKPVFPFIIGNKFKSKPNEFNFKKSSNQNSIDLNKTSWSRNINPYNLVQNKDSYPYLELPNDLNQTIDIKYASPGSIEKIHITSGGSDYKVGDKILFDNTETNGYNASAEVERISGKSVNSISVASTSIFNVEFYSSGNQGEFLLFSENPHGLRNKEIISISGFNTTSSLIEDSYIIGVSTNTLSLASSISNSSTTGIVTYFSVSGNLNYPNICENDILQIGSEKIKVLNVDKKSSRIRVLRQVEGTVSSSHNATDILYEISRKLTINPGVRTQYSYKPNRQLYFNPSDSLGIGTISGVGIGKTITFSNPGAGTTQIFIPTRTIYIPNHQLQTGDQVIYYTNGDTPIGVSTNGISNSVTLSNQSTLYIAKITDDLIGISTFKVGLGTQGTFVGLTSQTSNYGLLYLTDEGLGKVHSFKTTYSNLTGNIFKNTVTVSTAQSHGLLNNDIVFVDVNTSVSTNIIVKYDDFNKKLLINPKNFIASDVNIDKNIIKINNHGFKYGQKVVYTSSSPSGGLQNNKEYYIFVVDENNIKLTNTYNDAVNQNPNSVNITSASLGTLSSINPKITAYKNSSLVFDVSDPSLSYLQQSTLHSAFDLRFFKDSNLTDSYIINQNDPSFEVEKIGSIGITSDAKVILKINENTPENLYYNLVPIFKSYDNILPNTKKLISVDNEVISNNLIKVESSKYNGSYSIISTSNSSFTYNITEKPENSSYNYINSKINYETVSKNATGAISKIKFSNKGQNYYSLPIISSIQSEEGKDAILELSSSSIGKIKKTKINDIGFNFPSDFTLRPSVSLPQVLKVDPLSSFESIGVTSFGRGYTNPPKLIVFDGKTNIIVPEVDLKYDLNDKNVEILQNTFSLNPITPKILPIQNSNGVGISSVEFNSETKDVIVTLSVGFSTEGSFPFEVNDKVLIENIAIKSDGKGFNSEDYNYELFTLTGVTTAIGGIGSVTYNLNEFLNGSETTGEFDVDNSSGRIIPEKYFPTFEVSLKKNNYLVGEKVTSESSIGVIEDWDPKTNFAKIISKDDFKVGNLIVGSTSRTQGIASSISVFDAFLNLDSSSKFENGWQLNAGFLNDNIQRIQDSFYYQNFSYSLKSRVDYDTWNDAVSTLNHTSGFKKFSDYQLETKPDDETSLNVGLNTTSIEIITDIISVMDLNCVNDFDLVSENVLRIGNKILSDEIIFSSRILTDYSESIGNRVLSIDDVSPLFNSNPRLTKFSEVDRFNLSDVRALKYITYVTDRRFLNNRQVLIVTGLIGNNKNAYLNQYARVESNYDIGSFDLAIDNYEGVLNFYPTNFEVNDFFITTLSYKIDDNLSSVGNTYFGDVINVESNGAFVSNNPTTIVSIGKTYTSSKILVCISSTNDQYEFDELTVIHNGTDVNILEYGQLTSHSNNTLSSSGLGTYYSYISGSNLNIDFIPNVGIAATVNTVQVSFASTTSVGIGTYETKHALIEGRSVSIGSSSNPVATEICKYSDTYDGSYLIVQVSDITNNEHQISEIACVDDSSNVFITEYGILNTSSGLGTIGAYKSMSSVIVTFTPNPDIDVNVKVYLNALKNKTGEKDILVL